MLKAMNDISKRDNLSVAQALIDSKKKHFKQNNTLGLR